MRESFLLFLVLHETFRIYQLLLLYNVHLYIFNYWFVIITRTYQRLFYFYCIQPYILPYIFGFWFVIITSRGFQPFMFGSWFVIINWSRFLFNNYDFLVQIINKLGNILTFLSCIISYSAVTLQVHIR